MNQQVAFKTMKLGFVPASAGASYHEQCLVNKLHGIGQLFRFDENLGQETTSELHPDQRASRF
jgi:hypothetical protein